MKEKIIHIIAEVDKSHHFEWISLQLKDVFDYRCILVGNVNTEHEKFLKSHAIPVYSLRYRSKRSIFSLIWALARILRKEKPDIVHTHFWIASLIGIPIAWMLRIRIKMLTRHHGDLHHKYYPKGVYLDKILNRLADHVITPTDGIKRLIQEKENAREEKVTVIHHGVDLEYYRTATEERKQSLRAKYKIPETHPVIGIISRYIELKGIPYAIDAFKEILVRHPNAHLVLANANGDYRSVVRSKLADLKPEQFTEINYESDTPALYSLFDVFLHVSIDRLSESFGLTYIEALAAGKPCVFTLAGIAGDFIRDRYNALVVDFKNSAQIRDSILEILADETLRKNLGINGRDSVQHFSFERMCLELIEVYRKLLEKKLK